MKIIRFEAENIKKLRVVEIAPQGNIVEITGPNGAGKSSVLDAIRYAMEGAAAIPSIPLRKGAQKGHVTLNLGDLIVTRRFGAGGSTELRVESQDGTRLKSPQQILDQLYGTLAFDPLEFSRMKPDAQLAELRKLVKLNVDIDALDDQNRLAYDERTNLNRQAKYLTAQAEGIMVPADTPSAEVDVSGLLRKLEEASKVNSSVLVADAKRQSIKASLDSAEKQLQMLQGAEADTLEQWEEIFASKRERGNELVSDAKEEAQRIIERATAEARRLVEDARDAMQAKLRELESQTGAASASIERFRKELHQWPMHAPINTEDLRLQISQAQSTNRNVQLKAQRDEITKQAAEFQAQSLKRTRAIEQREEQKRQAIADAKMPVPGLSFGDGQILLDGIPFDQASSAEQLKVSTAIAIARNPKLRVIRIQDGSLLDESSMAVLAEMAEENDMQIWLERVTGSGSAAVVIEDGQIKE